jgi:ligand-binding sensor domain-containing protein/AraC-like DNA-binding protein
VDLGNWTYAKVFEKELQLRIILLVLLHLLLIGAVMGVDPEIPLDRLLVEEWTQVHGITSDTINSIHQTCDGSLWLGSNRDLFRYDGATFEGSILIKSTSTEGNRISHLFVNQKGMLLIGSSSGLYSYHEDQLKSLDNKRGEQRERISVVLEDKNGTLWIGTADNYLHQWKQDKTHKFDEYSGITGRFITSIIEDSAGSIWASTLSGGLYKYSFGKFKKVEVRGITARHTIHSLFEDSKGNIWIGTNMGIFWRRDQGIRVFTTGEGLSDNRVNTIIEDKHGSIWIGTVNGINRLVLSPSGECKIESRLKNTYINCLFEDREGSIWIGSNGSYLKRIREGIFFTYTTEHGISNFISSVYEDRKGVIWIGTRFGKLYYIKAGVVEEFLVKNDILDLRIITIGESPGGEVLVGTRGNGLFQIRGTQLEKYPGGGKTKIGDTIQSLYLDTSKQLWIGTFNKGIFILKENSCRNYTVRDGLLSNFVLSIEEDNDHNIWISTNSGINFLEKGHIKKKQELLKGTFTLSVYHDAVGDSWISTLGKGLVRYRDGVFNFITKRNGLGTDNIHHVLEDEKGFFWISSDVGVLRVDKNEVIEFSENRIGRIEATIFGKSDGMKSTDSMPWSGNSSIKTTKGEFWFATKKGVSIVQPSKIEMSQLSPPPVIIKKIVLDGKADQSIKGSMEKVYRNIDQVAIYFTAPTFIRSDRVKFRYQLEGYDENWKVLAPGKERVLTYSGLQEGEYTFRVTACKSEGRRNSEEAQFQFSIRSGFSINWMIIVVVLLVLVSVGFLFWVKSKERIDQKYKTSTLDKKKSDEYLQKIIDLMGKGKLYRDEELSLKLLSKKTGISVHHLSQVINERLEKNFFDFINTYRIEEAKKLLVNPKQSHKKILSIAFDVGFNTKAAFNRVFKKYTNITPSEYKKKHSKMN